ncbi:glutamyl aminopeptidase-like isoform X1 [Lucilia sericata]|uniref:glutamyl aminopeptidase-like isoform X1 n=2 Tax=Lucilia sericata TaxID=13632 RepID=UPI0018A83FE7|nr:glutamyl aminopeptidase-like isoform X1 [Lucilia sericata]XP_037807873.1 glutamyl aminopeptidase-like isoform X1 [Lucilia sericata]XP_037807883.1 glutamyl aminopeptidase-like isoform X1 [Lucilia sericata]XP_037807891.1 glutamyl aminopeptidase-like isoform X1 [Lucilia sericata]
MYPPQQHQPKMPIPIRPRSSLSTDEHHHRMKETHHLSKKPSNAVLTLAGFCIFLLVLCVFLLGALVYVGRNIVNEQNYKVDFTYNDTIVSEEGQLNDILRLSTKPILRFRPVTPTTQSPHKSTVFLFNKTTIAPSIMATSKVLQHLSFRLPRELRPLRYNLILQPDLKNKTFSGNVTIRLEVIKPISYIPVHSKFLSVVTKEVMQLGNEEKPSRIITPSLTFEHPQLEYWVTEFAEPLEVGNYSLQLAFNGSLVERIVGFYQSSYFDKQRNEKRWIATSKFEPTYARQAFPCFDEPSMKAMFTITVVRPSGDGYHALSNMNVEEEKDIGGGLTEVTFAESVPMSTYLACFIVSDFAHKSKMVKGTLEGQNDFEMRVFATAAQVDKVDYALNVGASVTEFYIDYFNISYPLPKLDMAAIPDFVSGAMEHWGLVTYRETALLYDKTISSSSNQQRVATVVAHELAHMWFGNLVTMKWWNDLWLNEGFASYIEYKGVNHVHPDWQMLDQFLIADLHGVMKLDATLASHPIVQTVESPNQITELFDSITYSKGASIIRMLEDLVGAEKFRNATTNYLNRFYYQNAETNDFLSELEALNFDFDVKLIMQTWTEQMGLPVVEVTRTGNSYKLTQKRFFANPEDYNGSYEDSEFNYHWSIPITYFTSANSEVQRAIFNYNDNELTVTTPAAVEWIKFNKDQVGYYRVNYPTDMWQSLTKALFENRGVFSVSDRAHLINDAFVLADAGQVDYSIALELSKYLEKELDYVPWNVAASRLSAIKNLLYFTDLYRDFVDYARQLLKTAYESVTWNVGDDHLQNLLRVTILNAACGYGNSEALEEAGKRFSEWLANPSVRPNPDIRSTVYYYGMKVAGNEETWNQVFDLFVTEQDAQEKVKLMEALAAINEPWILQRYINLAWNESYVRSQDYFSCLQYIAQNRVGQPLVWDYVRENWPRLVERFGINERYLGRMIPSITSRFATQTKLEEMEAFFAKYPEAGAGTAARKEALENVKNNIKWLEQNYKPVGDWLQSQKATDDSTESTTANSIN